MRKTIVLFSAAVVALCLGTPPPSQAAVIDFNTHPNEMLNPMFDGGFTFVFDAGGWGIFDEDSGAFGDPNYNGTPALYAAGDREGRKASVLMSKTGGGTFDVSSFLAATYFMSWPEGTLDVIGNLSGGGTVSASFALTSTFATFTLPDTFTNLDSLMFRDSASGEFFYTSGFSIDDIDLSRAAAVPEPGGLSLLGMGLTGLILAYRRHKG